ncbi:hypothetical protein INR49_013949 [Caranx melampygus]|nr:hypothetical protein INR49_013949 [Caranx melampygus]
MEESKCEWEKRCEAQRLPAGDRHPGLARVRCLDQFAPRCSNTERRQGGGNIITSHCLPERLVPGCRPHCSLLCLACVLRPWRESRGHRSYARNVSKPESGRILPFVNDLPYIYQLYHDATQSHTPFVRSNASVSLRLKYCVQTNG